MPPIAILPSAGLGLHLRHHTHPGMLIARIRRGARPVRRTRQRAAARSIRSGPTPALHLHGLVMVGLALTGVVNLTVGVAVDPAVGVMAGAGTVVVFGFFWLLLPWTLRRR